MRIDNTYLANVQASATRNTASPTQTSALSAGKSDATSADSEHVSSPELVQLQQLLQLTPQTRADRIADVAEKLANGSYLTPAAANQTAAAILGSGE